MTTACSLCDGQCDGAELAPLLDDSVRWLWEQIASAADRRGDSALETGSLTIRAPLEPEERAAVSGLVGGRPLLPEQRRRIDLAHLTQRVRSRGASLTPGAVAAHATNRRLAVRAAEASTRAKAEGRLKRLLADGHATICGAGSEDAASVWQSVRRSGWIGRLLSGSDPEGVAATAIGIVAALPEGGSVIDRRRLAADATGNPHALDEGTPLAGFVLGLLVAAQRVRPRQRARDAWMEVGVAWDDVTGGLVSVGVLPTGWSVPSGAIVTLPPRVVGDCSWDAPTDDASWVFVTENPSVASAAADLAGEGVTVRLLCTNGTPSAREVAAIARLAESGWRLAVRADFDEAGIAHVQALLDAVPTASPWRMGSPDYAASLIPGGETAGATLRRVPPTPWDASLRQAMRSSRAPAFEESLLPALLEDLRRGRPPPPHA